MRTEKRSSPQISGDMVSLHNMVSLQNGDTRSAPPPPSGATDKAVVLATMKFTLFFQMIIVDFTHYSVFCSKLSKHFKFSLVPVFTVLSLFYNHAINLHYLGI